MRKIIICFLGLCIVGLRTSLADTIWIKQDSAIFSLGIVQNDTLCLNENKVALVMDKIIEEAEIKMSNSVIIKETIKKIGLFTICAFILLLGLMVGALYALYRRMKKVEENYPATGKGLTSMEERATKTAERVEKQKSEVTNGLKQMVKLSEYKQERMTTSMPMATNKQEETDDTSRHPNEKENFPPKIKDTHNNKETILYAKPRANGKEFKVTEEQEATYIIMVGKGKFRLCEKEEQKLTAIKNKEVILTPFCNVTGSSIGAKSIKTVKEGDVENAGGDIWKVINKAEIEFIK